MKKAYTFIEIIVFMAVIAVAVFIALAVFSPRFQKIGKIILGYELPGKPDEGFSGKEEVTEKVQAAFDGFYGALVKAKNTNECYMKYPSLNLGTNVLEVEYIERMKGTNLRLMNEKGIRIAEYFVDGLQPCIALPDKKRQIELEQSISNINIKGNNKAIFWNDEYSLFPKYPFLHIIDKKFCFFTDSSIISPQGDVYGERTITRAFTAGFNEKDMTKII